MSETNNVQYNQTCDSAACSLVTIASQAISCAFDFVREYDWQYRQLEKCLGILQAVEKDLYFCMQENTNDTHID